MVIESSGPLRMPPSFVLCGARSGATLLRYVLDTHPELCAPPELQIGALCERLVWLHTYTVDEELELDPGWAAASAHRRTRHVVDEIMHAVCKREGKMLWCEKSLSNLQQLRTLGEVYPDARLIFLHRHCLDMVASGLEMQRVLPGHYGFEPYLLQQPGNPFAGLVEYWCDITERLLTCERVNARRSTRLRYEDLVRRPRRVLPRVFALLELDWTPELLARMFAVRHARGPGDPKITRTSRIESGSVGRGMGLPWRSLEPQRLERVQTLLARLGYPPLGAAAVDAELQA